MVETSTFHITCPKCQYQQTYMSADYENKKYLLFACKKCGHSQTVVLPEDDLNQASARIVRDATEQD